MDAMRQPRAMYMHTLDGRPAMWDAGDRQLYMAGGRHRATLHGSVREIRRQQAAHKAARAAEGFDDSGWRYGYVLVEVPDVR